MNRAVMRRRWYGTISALLAIALGWYAVWCGTDRDHPVQAVDLHLTRVVSVGPTNGQRNILAIQPEMFPNDYASEAQFARKLDGYFAAARADGMIGDHTVVVLPEYLGAWLVVLNEKASVYRAATVRQAMTTVILSNPLAMTGALMHSPAPDRIRDAIFHMKAAQMAAAYQRTFSQLAQTYQTTIIAGSIVLPAPKVTNGVLACGNGPLENVTVVFHPDGQADAALVRKVKLTSDERAFLHAGSADALPVFPTTVGRVGILICADAWFPELYHHLRVQHMDVLVVPSFITGDGKLAKPWQGYSGAAAPADVNPADIRHLSLGQAWERYATVGRFSSANAQVGVQVCLRGRLWDIGSDGGTLFIDRHVIHCPNEGGASLASLRW